MRNVERRVREDIQRAAANRVVYLEDDSDVTLLCALIGRARPADDQLEGVLVRGAGGSGPVAACVKTAQEQGLPHVYGIVDGDGRDLAQLTASFRGGGPLFHWRAYAIENLLVRAGWPPAWGPAPDWPAVMLAYSALVGLNRTGKSLRDELYAHRLMRFVHPEGGADPHDRATVRATLVAAQRAVHRDLAAEFDQHADRFETLVRDDVEAAHAWLDGKWLVDHHVRSTLKRPNPTAWIDHVTSIGGLPEVSELWSRLRP